MKKSLFIICCICIVTEAIAQKCPEGFHKAMYRGEVTLIRPDNDIIKPAADFYACVSDKASATGLEVFWSVKALFHNYKYIKFTKRIELTCGKVITEDVELDGMKKDEVRVGGSFAGEMQLSNNFYNDACNGQKVGIKSLDVENITAELYDDDILSPQWNRKQNEIRKELTEKFNNKLTAARTALDTIKNNNPDKAANYENTHGAVISQMKNNFQDEVNKGSKADQQKLQGYMTSLENETAQLAEISEANPGKKNTSSVAQNANSGNNQTNINPYQNKTTNSNNGKNSSSTNAQYNAIINKYNINITNIQNNYERNSALLNTVGNSFLTAMNQEFDRKMADHISAVNNKLEKCQRIVEDSRTQRSSAREYTREGKYIESIQAYKYSIYLSALDLYNNSNLIHLWFTKDSREFDKKTYPKISPILLFEAKNKGQGPKAAYTFSNLPDIEHFILPDVFYIPVCRLLNTKTDNKNIYDSSYSFLATCDKCKKLDVGNDGVYSVECTNQQQIPLSEDSATKHLKDAILKEAVTNSSDLLYFSNSVLMYVTLNLKNAKTIADLKQGISIFNLYYSIINKYVKGNFEVVSINGEYDLSAFDGYGNYLKFSENIINYYYASYFQLLSINLNNEAFSKWANEMVQKISTMNYNRDEGKNNLEQADMVFGLQPEGSDKGNVANNFIDYAVDSIWQDGTNTFIRIKKYSGDIDNLEVNIEKNNKNSFSYFIPIKNSATQTIPSLPTFQASSNKIITETWNENDKYFVIKTNYRITDILKIEVDPNHLVNDVNRKNNSIEFKW